jgi:chorismate mutase
MNSQITDCRSALDEIDRQLVALVEKRFQRARELAHVKKQSGVPVIDRARELSTLKRVAALSSQSACRANIVARFRQVLQESRAVQLMAAEPEDRPKKRQLERRLS